MQKITKETMSHIEAEYAKWGDFLNGIFGIVSFSFGLACLSTPRPDITGFLSLVFLLAVSLNGRDRLLPKLTGIRKEELSGFDKRILSDFEKKYFSLMAVIRNFPVAIMGWLFLGGVVLYGIWV